MVSSNRFPSDLSIRKNLFERPLYFLLLCPETHMNKWVLRWWHVDGVGEAELP